MEMVKEVERASGAKNSLQRSELPWKESFITVYWKNYLLTDLYMPYIDNA